MSEAFATVQDIMDLWRPLTADEQTRAGNLLPLVSDTLRNEAKKVGKDLDTLVTEDETYSSVVKLVTVDVVARVLRQTTTGDAMTQESQSAGGYSWSGTYAVPGGGIANAILYSDLKRLGLLNQQIGSVRLWQRSRENQ
jgi:hypothetical protein